MKPSSQPSNGVPIYEQLVWQVKCSIAEGVTRPGQLIPSVRKMAEELSINPNTVQRAYIQLQDEEIVHPLRGRGIVVSGGAEKRCIMFRQEILKERFAALVADAIMSGLSTSALREMFDASLATWQTLQSRVEPTTVPKVPDILKGSKRASRDM